MEKMPLAIIVDVDGQVEGTTLRHYYSLGFVSCLKVGGWVVVGDLQDFSVNPRPLCVLLGFNWGLGLGGFGTKGLRA